MYNYGKSVPQDYAEALKWYGKSAEQGNDHALLGLGVLYVSGDGVAKDYIQAFKWFHLSAHFGNKEAEEHRDRTQYQLSQQQIDKAVRLSREWWEKRYKAQ